MIEVVMEENLLDASHPDEDPAGIRGTLLSNFSDIRKRNEALSFRNSPTKVSAKLSAAVSHVKVRPSSSAHIITLELMIRQAFKFAIARFSAIAGLIL